MNTFNTDQYFRTRLPFDPRRATVWQEICGYLRRRGLVPRDGVVVDIGAGYGEFINHVDARERHAVDVSGDLAAYFRPDVTLHVSSCAHMPTLASSHFDLAFSSNVFEHLTREELDSTLSEIWRILKPGGYLAIVQPNFRYSGPSYFDDYTHLQVFTHISLADLLGARGFSVVRVEGRFLPLSVKSTRLPIRGFLIRAYLSSPIRPFAGQMLVVARKPSVR
jgi:SAM-dependent methyltransferase